MSKTDPVRAAVLADRRVARDAHIAEIVALHALRAEYWGRGSAAAEATRHVNDAIRERSGMWATIQTAWDTADRKARKRSKR